MPDTDHPTPSGAFTQLELEAASESAETAYERAQIAEERARLEAEEARLALESARLHEEQARLNLAHAILDLQDALLNAQQAQLDADAAESGHHVDRIQQLQDEWYDRNYEPGMWILVCNGPMVIGSRHILEGYRRPDDEDDEDDYEVRDEDDLECAICKEDYQNFDLLTRLPCRHTFHRRCAENAFRSRDTCPMCRTPVPLTYVRRRDLRRRYPHLVNIF